MATEQKSSSGDGGGSIDPKSGFCSKTKTFHSLRPKSQLPLQTMPLSLTHYLLSRLHQSPPRLVLPPYSTPPPATKFSTPSSFFVSKTLPPRSNPSSVSPTANALSFSPPTPSTSPSPNSHVAWAPPVAAALAKYGNGNEMGGYDLSSLQVIACGGAPLAKSVIEKLRERLPNVQVSQAYGMTETTARVFAAVGPEETGVEGANGKLMSDLEAKIVDPESGAALPPLMHGELWVRGPNIMKGYVGDEAATAAILDSEGWLKTGDICYIDNQGFLFFVDRLKELIKYKGYQVAPAELEDLLHSHPDIVDAAVISYPDEEAGQVPMAVVVRCLGSAIDEPQIKDFIAKQVAPYKKIRRVTFTKAIPKNAQGKVLRKELIKLAPSKL